jgi:hypothetical protein
MRKTYTKAAFSRYMGVSKSCVSKWLKMGIITALPDGRLDLHACDRRVAEYWNRPRRFRDDMEHDLLRWRTEKIRQQAEMLVLRRRCLEGKLIPLTDHQRELREVRQDFLDELRDKIRLIMDEIYDRNPDDFFPSRIELILSQELRRRLSIY